MIKAFVAALLLLSSTALAGARYDASVIGPMNGESLAATYKEILDAPGPEVSLEIFSPGGSALATLLFINLVRDRIAEKHLHITCVGTGMVASAAAILMESPVCETRVLEPQAFMMFHEAYLTGGGPVLKDAKDFLHSLNFAIASLIAPRLGLSPEGYLAWVSDGVERWVTAPLALGGGMVDRVGYWTGLRHSEPPPPL